MLLRAHLVLILTGVLWAQAPGPAAPGQSGLVLRSTTKLVQVNVIVQDGHGRPVSDLKKEDFTIKDGGKVQEIRSFSVESKDKPYQPGAKLPPNVFTNRLEQREGTPTSVTVILLDGLNTDWGNQMTASAQVIRFLQQIQPSDRVAIYVLGRTLRVLHDYTNDSSSLLKTLASFTGSSPTVLQTSRLSTEEEPESENNPQSGVLNSLWQEVNFNKALRITTSLKAMEAIANHLQGIPGRKNVIWVSSGFPFAITSASFSGGSRGFSPASQADPRSRRAPSMGRDYHLFRDMRTFSDEATRAVRAMNNANLAIYAVDASGLLPTGATEDRAALVDLSSRTGGKAYLDRNDLDNAIREAVQDSQVTYNLAYYPNSLEGNGRFRDIKVAVSRPGLKLRYRRGYFDFGEHSRDEKAIVAEMRDAAWSPLDATGVAMDARLDFTTDAGAPALLVHAVIDPASISLESKDGRWQGRLEFLFIQTDEAGREYDTSANTLTVNMGPQTYESVRKTGLIYRALLPRKSGARKFRIVVCDAPSGNTGSVTIPFQKVVGDLRSGQ